MARSRTKSIVLVLVSGLVLVAGLTFAAGPALFGSTAPAQVAMLDPRNTKPQEIPLWPATPPGSEHWTQKPGEIALPKVRIAYNIVTPTLTAFFPNPGTANGTAVIIAPGGGFRMLSIENEGYDVARWLAARGITAFVLKYRTVRMPDGKAGFMIGMKRYIDSLQAAIRSGDSDTLRGRPDQGDAETPARLVDWPGFAAADGVQAIKLVRANADGWGLARSRVGILGFSAGAAVAYATVLGSAPGEMPAFVAPIYYSLAPDVPLPGKLPPAFFAAASDDPIARGMPATYSRWIAGGGSAALHMWERGGHGFGMDQKDAPTDAWAESFIKWLIDTGMMPKKQ